MKISIKTPIGKLLSLDVEPTDTVQELKAKIKKHESQIEIDKLNLIFVGIRLDNSRDLASYNVREDSTLYLFSKFETSIRINVNIIEKNKKIRLSIEESDFIETLKEKIFQTEKIPINQQKLLFTDKELNNKKRLSEYNIKAEAELTLILEKIVHKSSTCSIL
jgi:ubiquitin C